MDNILFQILKLVIVTIAVILRDVIRLLRGQPVDETEDGPDGCLVAFAAIIIGSAAVVGLWMLIRSFY